MKLSIKDFFSKCDQIQNDQIFCAVIIKAIMSRYDLTESIMSFVITLQKKISGYDTFAGLPVILKHCFLFMGNYLGYP